MQAICELRGVIAYRHGGTHNLLKVHIHGESGKTFQLWPASRPAMQASVLQLHDVL